MSPHSLSLSLLGGQWTGDVHAANESILPSDTECISYRRAYEQWTTLMTSTKPYYPILCIEGPIDSDCSSCQGQGNVISFCVHLGG